MLRYILCVTCLSSTLKIELVQCPHTYHHILPFHWFILCSTCICIAIPYVHPKCPTCTTSAYHHILISYRRIFPVYLSGISFRYDLYPSGVYCVSPVCPVSFRYISYLTVMYYVLKVQNLRDGWMKADVWSLGATILEMSTGSPPWEGIGPLAAMFKISCTR